MKKILTLNIVLTCFCTFTFGQQKTVPYGNNTAAGKFYNIRGIKMYCEVYGKGKPILMIHGNGGSIAAFSKTIPYFEKNIR